MPKVNSKESKEHYLSRCIPVVLKEGGKGGQAHAIAKCSGMYEESKKRKKAHGSQDEPDFDKENETKIAIIIPPIL